MPETLRPQIRYSHDHAAAPVPPSSLDPREARARARGEHDFRDFQGSKCRNLYSPAPVPPRPLRARARGSTIFETFKAQNAEMRPCPPPPAPSSVSKCRNLYSPAPVLPSSLDAREASARARGSTIFETFFAQNAEICTPPRPCPPVPEHGRTIFEAQNAEICTDLREARAPARGSKAFKAQNAEIYSPAPVPPAPWSVSTIFETFRVQKAEICTPST